MSRYILKKANKKQKDLYHKIDILNRIIYYPFIKENQVVSCMIEEKKKCI